MYLSTLRPGPLEGVLSARTLERKTDRTLTTPDELRRELALTRERGYSTDDEEFMAGMVAVAVPVRDGQSRLLATLSIHAPVQRYPLADLIGCLPVLHGAAQSLSDITAQ